MELRDAIQRVALADRSYGYRRVSAGLRGLGWVANHKRVLRLLREDNLRGTTAPELLAAPVGRCGRASIAGNGCPLCSGHLQVAAISIRRRRSALATDSRHPYYIYPSHAAGMSLGGCNQLWVADITYIRLREQFSTSR